MQDKKIKSALISVFDKEGLEPIVTKLTENVKTLHPKIFGGILNQRDSKKDQKDVKKYDIPHIDLVIVDLYPFEETVVNDEATHEDIIEKIDIGGISLIRAAGKNHKDVLVISTKDQYDILEKIIDDGLTTTLEEREVFAIDAFNVTSNYDTEIFKYLLGESDEDEDVQSSLGSEKSGVNLNINKDDYHLNDYLICWEKFGHRPNKILIHNTYSGKLFDEVISKYIIEKNIFTEVIPDTEELIINYKLFIKIDDYCYLSYIVADRLSESSFIDSISFYYANGYEKVQEFIDELNDCVLDYEDDSNKLNTISL